MDSNRFQSITHIVREVLIAGWRKICPTYDESPQERKAGWYPTIHPGYSEWFIEWFGIVVYRGNRRRQRFCQRNTIPGYIWSHSEVFHSVWLSDDSLLNHEDEAVPILSANVLTILLGSSTSVQISIPALKTYFTWLCTLCQKPHTNMQDLAVQYFAGALRTSRSRLVFWNPELACSIEVVTLLKTKKDLQLQYHALLVVWLITFEKKIARELNQ